VGGCVRLAGSLSWTGIQINSKAFVRGKSTVSLLLLWGLVRLDFITAPLFSLYLTLPELRN